MNNLECPYCEAHYEACQDDGNLCEPGELYEEECPKCEKHFIATVEWEPQFTASKADCLNGGEHDLKETQCYPTATVPEIKCKACGLVARRAQWKEGV